MRHIALLPGVGIGPVVLAEAVRVLGVAGLPATWVSPEGDDPAEALALVRSCRVGLVGPDAVSFGALGVRLLRAPISGELQVLGLPFDNPPDADAVRGLLADALARARRRVTIAAPPTSADLVRGVAAALLGPAGVGLVREGRARVTPGEGRAPIQVELVRADEAVAALLRRPEDLEIVVAVPPGAATVLRVAAEMGGGPLRLGYAGIGPGCTVFAPAHGPALALAARSPASANPTGAILAGAMLLEHLGADDAAARVRDAVERTIRDGPHPPDLGGDATAEMVGAAVARHVGSAGRPGRPRPPRRAAFPGGPHTTVRHLAAVLSSVSDGLISTDTEGRVGWLNPTAARLTGWDLYEAQGRPLAEVLTTRAEDPSLSVDDPVAVALRGGMLAPDPVVLVARDGTELPIDRAASPVRDARGRVLGVLVTFGDATAGRRAAAALHVGRDRDESATAPNQDTFWDWDLAASPFPAGDLPPSDPAVQAWVDRLHPQDRERVVEQLRNALAGPDERWDDEYRYRRADGSYAQVFARGFILRRDGVPVRILGVLIDVTERRELQARLRLADRWVSVGALVGGVAHAINNPLQAATGAIETALEALLDSPDERAALARTALARATIAAERASREVRNLQGFVRPEGERIAPVDLAHALDHAIDLAANELRHRARLIRQYSPVPPIVADQNRLEQLFLNLLVHAARSIPEGRADANEIRVVLRPAGRTRVAIEVHDTGPGIPEELLPRLFDAFAAHPEGPAGGLGLAICRDVVATLGGEIQVETEPGRGSCLHVFLPAGAHPAGTSPPSRPPAAAAPARGRVLVVEDDEDVAEVICRALGGRHEVLWLSDAREALARIGAGERWDAILCDLMMPELSGMELHAELSRLSDEQAARMIFMSGGVFSGRGVRFLENLPNPFLEKPFTMRGLREVVARMVTAGPHGRSAAGDNP